MLYRSNFAYIYCTSIVISLVGWIFKQTIKRLQWKEYNHTRDEALFSCTLRLFILQFITTVRFIVNALRWLSLLSSIGILNIILAFLITFLYSKVVGQILL